MASILRFDNWQNSDGTSIATTDASGNISFAGSGAGKILQVVSTTKDDTYANASGGLVTGLTVTITPTSTSSDIIVIADVAWSASAIANISTLQLYDVTNSTVAFPAASGTTYHRYGRLIQVNNSTLWRDQITGRASPATTSPL